MCEWIRFCPTVGEAAHKGDITVCEHENEHEKQKD